LQATISKTIAAFQQVKVIDRMAASAAVRRGPRDFSVLLMIGWTIAWANADQFAPERND
jgi:hypothetical protein